MIIELNLP